MKKSFSRRNFIKGSTLGVIGGVMSGSGLSADETKTDKKTLQDPFIKTHRKLGRTGFKVSDISLGISYNSAVIEKAINSGVNYIDTAESYKNQPVIGKALKNFDRKKIFITSKLEIKRERNESSFIKRFNRCLKELGTDYLDCMMAHCPEDLDALKTPGFHSAMKQMKKEGKLRFVGVSHHGSNWFKAPKTTMATILNEAVKDGRFDLFLMAYNFIQEDLGAEIITNCVKEEIGVTLMKVNPVGKYYAVLDRIKQLEKEKKKVHPLYREGIVRFKKQADHAEKFIKKYKLTNPGEIRDAAIKFVLSNPGVNTVCCSMRNFEHVDQFLDLSGTTLSNMEKKKISYYKKGPGRLYCRQGCTSCESECPSNLSISDMMRYNHYFDAHGREKVAIEKYKRLKGHDARLCSSCDAPCESACPYGLPVQGLLSMVHKNLTVG